MGNGIAEREFMDCGKLAQALEAADLRVLLMALFHHTGDRRWIEPPFLPKRDVQLIAEETAGFDAETQARIKHEAARILADSDDAPAVGDPGPALMVEMMSACLGEEVPAEYAGMMREEMGFVSRQVTWNDATPVGQPFDGRGPLIAIAGAGASGIALGANLEKLGIPYVIFEQNDEVGGTWYRNRYPGCGVDTPNHAYSFSFGSRYPWGRYFAPREQCQDYLERIADETNIRANIRFNTTVVGATWDEGSAKWRIAISTPSGEETVVVSWFISAIGQLSQPFRMPIKGEEGFEGPLFHPIDWPDGLDLAGKRLALIGTGATAMQIVPEIVDTVQSLTVYQRTPQWARPIPRYHDPISEGAQWLLKNVPYYAQWFRFTMLWRYGDGLLPFLKKDPDWPHPDRSINRINDRHRVEMLEHMKAELGDRTDLIDKCTPSYPPYGKRILLDAGWFGAIRRGNVELVSEAVDHIQGDTLVAADGTRRDADIVVVSTGYVVNQLAARLNVTGRNGQTLADLWGEDDISAYLGCTVPGFPNFFMIYGPNTGLAHGGSAIFMNECAVRYALGCIVEAIERDFTSIDLKQQALDDYVARVDAEHAQLVWTAPGLASYYQNSKGRVISANPWRLVDYWQMTHEPDLENYRVARRQTAAGASSTSPNQRSSAP